jgi:hypothetical protein
MQTYHFTAILADVTELTDEMCERLFEAGCDDGTPASSQDSAFVHFDREADSLEAAIRSAIANVQAAGYAVAYVKIETAELTQA